MYAITLTPYYKVYKFISTYLYTYTHNGSLILFYPTLYYLYYDPCRVLFIIKHVTYIVKL